MRQLATKETISRGIKYFVGKRIIIQQDTREFNGQVSGYALGSDEKTYDFTLAFSEDGNDILTDDCHCACPAFSEYKGLCKHLVAATMQAQGGTLLGAPVTGYKTKSVVSLQQNSDSDSHGAGANVTNSRRARSDYWAGELINSYRKKAYVDIKASVDGQVGRLEPTWVNNGTKIPFLTWKIGHDKLYVVRDVVELKDGFIAKQRMALGTSMSILLDIDYFDDASKKYAEFIMRYASRPTAQTFSVHSYRYNKKELELTPAALDDFIQIYEDSVIDLKSEVYGNRHLQILHENYRAKLRLTYEQDGATLSIVDADDEEIDIDDFDVFSGRENFYVQTQYELYCCTKDYALACGDLLKFIYKRGYLYFAQKDIPSLFGVVLKKAKPYLDIDAAEIPQELVPPPLTTKVYFDIDEYSNIIASMSHHYGDIDIEAFANKDLENNYDYAGEMRAEQTLLKYMGHEFKREIDSRAYTNAEREEAFPLKENAPRLLVLSDDDKIYELVTYGLAEIERIAEVYVSTAFDKIKVRPPVQVGVGIGVNGRLLEIDIDLDGLDYTELASVLKQYRKAKKYKRLKDGSFMSLEDDDAISRLAEVAEAIDLSDEDLEKGHLRLDINRSFYIDSILKKSEELRYTRDDKFKDIIRKIRDIDDSTYEAPAELSHVLRNYQKTGYRWMRTLNELGFGGILADDMGLGKTLQVLSLLQAKKDAQTMATQPASMQPTSMQPTSTQSISTQPISTQPTSMQPSMHHTSLVVCPASLVLNWEAEAQKFTPRLNVIALANSKEERLATIEQLKFGASEPIDLVVTSYGQLQRDIDELQDIEFDFAILDEAQFIKNRTTKSAKAVKKLRANTRLALTGTPVENNLAELWSIFDFCMPGYLLNYSHFKKRYEKPIVKDADTQATSRLRDLARPFIMRRLKHDVLKELPEKVETVIPSKIEGEQRKIYLATLAQTKKELSRKLKDPATNEAQKKIMILAALTRMRQICCDPSLVYENYEGESAKLESCMELIDSCHESGHRMLLFSQFTSMLSIIQKRLKQLGIPYLYLDGSTPKHDRMDMVNAFNEGDTPIFLISLKAGGTGLNLTGADIVIHYDPWWNVSAQNQATDRAHRIGQTQKVQVYKLIASNTIEEKIMELQIKKAELADKIIQDHDSNPFEAMTGDDLLNLLEER
jgi:SNF2 family DNA or RNA helicase